ncbi:YbaB/EbfC family nucleoid-associated protein [Micromonospora sp. NPDC049004]|uniref:YbaB/EbfC family nucleoid-associated protein n=1 Tax=Micromonospora sp. NPDC049004 TaxID=3154348 RepID=UPI0033ED4F6A
MAQFLSGDFGAATERFVASWSADISERAARAQELSERVAALSATAEGADGAVQVTVAASGAMTDLRLDDRVSRWRADEIAAEVLAVMRRAQGRLAPQVADAAAETVGADSETARAVVGSYERRFPEVPEEEDEQGYAGWGDRGR